MSQWFDIWSVEEPLERKEIQVDGLRESVAAILRIVRSESSLVPPERIILAGISQGCATAILALLRGGTRLGGFVGLCGWLPFQDDIERIAKCSVGSCSFLPEVHGLFKRLDYESNELSSMSITNLSPHSEPALETPVFLSHSADDDVVPIANGEKLSRGLKKLGLTVCWKAYEDGGHWVNEPRGVDDIISFLQDNTTITTTTTNFHALGPTALTPAASPEASLPLTTQK
jgi:lysophospholipase II